MRRNRIPSPLMTRVDRYTATKIQQRTSVETQTILKVRALA